MTPERWRQVKAVVQEALARPAPARTAFVAEACGDDAALRAEVESLLAGPDTGEESNGFLASPVDMRGIAAVVAGSPATGTPSEAESPSTESIRAAEAARRPHGKCRTRTSRELRSGQSPSTRRAHVAWSGRA